MTEPRWELLEEIVRRDPGGRGVSRYVQGGQPLGYGELELTAKELARSARRVAIVTGFCIADAEPPAAETDGPPGALFLGRALRALGVVVVFVTDCYGVPLLTAGLEEWRLSASDFEVLEMPLGNGDSTAWAESFLETQLARGITHVIAIERAGPSHTTASIAACEPASVAEQFEHDVPSEHRDKHHNMRGKIIDEYIAPVGRIFDQIAQRRLPIATIGIGDGGNEIGMGKFPWSVLRDAIKTGPAALTACRIATDHNIVAGVSNWGAYALGFAIAALERKGDLIETWTSESQQALIERIVAAGAVDGVLKQRALSVDGIALSDYLEVFASIHETALLAE